jgi:hypothetical protein
MRDPAGTNKQFGRVATLKAAFLVTGSTYASYAFGLITSALIARGLGPDDFGSYAYVIWLTGLLIMLGNNGLAISGIRFVSESHGESGSWMALAAPEGLSARGPFRVPDRRALGSTH